MTTATNTVEAQQDWKTCDGQKLKSLTQAGLYWLEKNHQHVNELNVFPVPDGDTGTNMLLTMRSAWRRIEASNENEVGKVAHDLSQGALMGARGNSGVILSQIWRGMARALKDKRSCNAADLGRAFKEAADTAYGGVMKPVEGTILTVIREGAEEAQDAAQKSDDIAFVLRRTITRCQQALERTPDLLPILKQAGVVDSGGQGLVYILRGMHQFMTGEMNLEAAAAEVQTAVAPNLPAQALAVPEGGTLENHYDVQFILLGQNLNVEEVRRTIDAMGDSTVVVGDETTIKVHVHVEDPGQPISYGISLGEITDVVVENMQMQMEEIVTGGAPATAELLPAAAVEPGQIAVVAVAPGEGFAKVLRGLGVYNIINGGQTNNPSTEEIFEAIQDAPTDKVIVLPNNKNIILAAEAARNLSTKQVAVVPTRTVPQGISALLALNPDGELHEVSAAMADLIGDVATVEITQATRSVELDGVEVSEGDIIGIVDGKLRVAGEEVPTVLVEALAAVEDMDEREIVTLFYGADATHDQASALADQITELYPEVEVEVQAGGQAHYFYILGIE